MKSEHDNQLEAAPKKDEAPADSRSTPTVPPEVRDYVEAKIKAELDRDREFIKGTLGTAAKIAGVSVIILGFLGYQSFKDVVAGAKETALKEVRQKLQLDDPKSPTWKSVDEMLDQAALNANVLSLARFHNSITDDVDSSEFEISASDALRVLNILTREATDEKRFADSLGVMLAVDDRKVRSNFEGEMTEMLLGEKAEYKWIDKQAWRRIAILQTIQKDLAKSGFGEESRFRQSLKRINPFVRVWIEQPSKEELQEEAVQFAIAAADIGAVEALGRIADSKESGTRAEAFKGLARLAPDSSRIQLWLTNFLATRKPEPRQASFGCELVWSALTPPLHREKLSERHQLSFSILNHIVDSGFTFKARFGDASLVSPGADKRPYDVPMELLVGKQSTSSDSTIPTIRSRYISSPFSTLLSSQIASNNLSSLSKTLKSISPDYQVILRKMPVPFSRRTSSVSSVGLVDGSSITNWSSSTLTVSNINNELAVFIASGKSDDRVKFGRIKEFVGAEQFRAYLIQHESTDESDDLPE